MLSAVGLFILCMENVNFFQPCILCLKQKLTLDHILLYKVSQKHLMVFLNEITFGKIVLTLVDAFSVSGRFHVNYCCLNVTLCR